MTNTLAPVNAMKFHIIEVRKGTYISGITRGGTYLTTRLRTEAARIKPQSLQHVLRPLQIAALKSKQKPIAHGVNYAPAGTIVGGKTAVFFYAACEPEKQSDRIAIRLFHGFKSEADREKHVSNGGGWGEDGPVLGPFDGFHVTYNSHFRGVRDGEQILELPTSKDGGCFLYNGMEYGDWSVIAWPHAEQHFQNEIEIV